MPRRPFRFGVLAGPAESRRHWTDGARQAEDLGYSIWLASDHFGSGPAPLPALSIAAEATGLRVGTLVVANDFRNPAALAKESATIDLLTDGRFELGIGTGWLESDYVAAGIPFDPPAARVERLVEAVDVIKGIWSGEQFAYHGDHYQVEIEGRPIPVQEPHPPLLIGGSGPRMIRFAARHADIVSVTATLGEGSRGGYWSAMVRSGSRIEAQARWIDEAAGDNRPEINVLVHELVVTDDRHGVASRVGSEVGVGPEEVLAAPHVLIGNTEEIAATIVERRERYGISYVVVNRDVMADMAPVVADLAGSGG